MNIYTVVLKNGPKELRVSVQAANESAARELAKIEAKKIDKDFNYNTVSIRGIAKLTQLNG